MRPRHLVNSVSSSLVRMETWPEETWKPQSFSMILVTRLGLMPSTIHGGDGGFERAFAAGSLLDKGGAKGRVAFTNLGDGELELAHGGLVTARFETVGVAVAGIHVALVGGGSDLSDSLEQHCGVHEEFGDFGDGVFEAVSVTDVDEIWMLDILCLFVHGLCCFWLAPSALGRGLAPTTPKADFNLPSLRAASRTPSSPRFQTWVWHCAWGR